MNLAGRIEFHSLQISLLTFDLFGMSSKHP